MARAQGTTLFVVRGREYGPEVAYETGIPGQYRLPKRPRGDDLCTLGVDCFESQSDARRLAFRHYRAETSAAAVEAS